MAEDDLRGDLLAAFKSPDSTPAQSESAPLPGSETPPPAIATPETAAPEATPAAPAAGAGQPRNADGTFAPKPGDAPPAATPAPATAVPAVPAGAQGAPATPPADRIAPPEAWKGGAKLKWEKLPKDVQQEIVADYARFGQSESQLTAYRQAIGPRAARLAAEYGSPERAIEQLLALSDYASNDPQGFVTWFAQSRGINLAGAAPQAQQPGQPAAPPANIDPALAQVLQPYLSKIDALEKRLTDTDAWTQQQQYRSTLSTVEQFITDPAHPYAAEVAAEMTRLIEGGTVQRGPEALQKAYEIATWANPTIRSQLIEQQREKERTEAASKVDAARKAGASLTGSPLPGASTATPVPDMDLRTQIATLYNAGGRI